jgi:YbgC/YbaW family acyl-CoA thioester hydrolase
VQFADTDQAGMVHFSMYLRYVEEAEHALWRSVGLTIADPATDIGFPRVAFAIDYHAPLRFEDEFEVRIGIESLSDKSIRYRSELWRGDVKVATSTHTAVCVTTSASPVRSIAIPDPIRARLEPLVAPPA